MTMQVGLTASPDELAQLRRSAHDALDRLYPLDEAHRTAGRPESQDLELWDRVTGLGWAGLAVSDEVGGAGYGIAEQAVVFEELGWHLFPTALVPTAVATAGIAQAAHLTESALDLVSFASEGRRATVAFEQLNMVGRSVPILTSTATVASVHGSAGWVLEGLASDEIVLAAADEGSGQMGLLRLNRDTPGVSVTAVPTMDRTRNIARVDLEDVRLPKSAVICVGEQAHATITRMQDLAAIAIACDCAGGASRILEITLDYVRQRRQFGRAIGSFQAIKHKCADMYVAVQGCRSIIDAAVETALQGWSEESTATASAAKAYCADSYAQVAGTAVQLHGGIGFTWEGDPQLFLKRAKLNQHLWGSSAWHRARAGRALF
jgi:alkylation response protein AidB-like acyl-CoA dehydrogenase